MGFWSQQKAHGIAQWSCDKVNEKFHLEGTVKFEDKNVLYRPWHIDFFECQRKLFAIVQSNQCNADICLAESKDRVHFRFFKKPLMTNDTCGKSGEYISLLPELWIADSFSIILLRMLMTWALNKLYLITMDFNELLKKLQ